MKGFVAGLGIGAAIGLLYAPRSGEALRNVLRRSAEESWQGARTGLAGRKQGREGFQPGRENRREPHSREPQEQQSMTGEILPIINEWPQERLMEIHGIGPVLASKIVKNRPYESEEELLQSKELPPSAIEALRKAS